MDKVNMRITVKTHHRGDCWTGYVPEFGFTVYGATEAEARREVDNALGALLGSFAGDRDSIVKFLKRRAVEHTIGAEPDCRVPGAEIHHAEVLIAA